MVIDNSFGRYIQSLFPSQTFFVGEPVPSVNDKPNIENYNRSIINTINQIFLMFIKRSREFEKTASSTHFILLENFFENQ